MDMDVIHEDRSTHVAVARVDKEFRLLSTGSIRPGESLFRIIGERTNKPTRYSVQIDRNTHIDLTGEHGLQDVLDRYYWRFLNHSCEPNAAIRGLEVVALRPITQWEEITFDYDTTEFDMAEPFECRCGSLACRGVIRGFKHLEACDKERLRPRLAPYLLRLLEEEGSVWLATNPLAEGGVTA